LLVSTEPGKLLARVTLDGRRRYVIHVQAAALSAQEPGQQGQSGHCRRKQADFCLGSEPGTLESGQEKG
jgi:hypothetical protein